MYYIGFILLNVTLMFDEYFMPRREKVSQKDLLFVFLNGAFIGIGIFANLAFEEIGFDLYFFGSVMLLALFLLYRRQWSIQMLPVLFYFATSYILGVFGTILYKLITSNF